MCKDFLLGKGGVDQYADVTVTFVRGQNPDLVLLEHGRETQRIDLTTYKTSEELHALFASKGFRRKGGGAQDDCFAWRDRGECLRNPTFMQRTCAHACAGVTDRHADCVTWSVNGECTRNPEFMYTHCGRACAARKEEL